MRRKKIKSKEKQARRKLLFLRITVLLSVAILVGGSYQLYHLLKRRTLPKEGRVVIGFQTDPLVLVSFSCQKNDLNFFTIPPETMIKTVGGYGQYQVDAIRQLSVLENKPYLLPESLAYYFALPIDGWVWEDGNWSSSTGKEAKKWLQDQLGAILKKREKTNLEFLDILKLWWCSFRVRPYQIELISLTEHDCLKRDYFPDGSSFFRPQLDKTDFLISQYFFDPKIKEENLAIGIANATDRPGLANEASRVVNNLGGMVVKLGDWRSKSAQSEVIVSASSKESYTAMRLGRYFLSPIKEGNLGQYLADILIVLGEDYGQKIKE